MALALRAARSHTRSRFVACRQRTRQLTDLNTFVVEVRECVSTGRREASGTKGKNSNRRCGQCVSYFFTRALTRRRSRHTIAATVNRVLRDRRRSEPVLTITRRAFSELLVGLGVAAAFPISLSGCARSNGEPPNTAVDTHAHVFTRDLPMPDQRRAPSGYDARPEDYLQQLDANGISHGVLVQPSFLGTDNSYLVDALRRYPQRLRGIAVWNPPSPRRRWSRLPQRVSLAFA